MGTRDPRVDAYIRKAAPFARPILSEIRETVQQIVVPAYVQAEKPKRSAAKKPLFAPLADDVLLGYGVPAEWLKDEPSPRSFLRRNFCD